MEPIINILLTLKNKYIFSIWLLMGNSFFSNILSLMGICFFIITVNYSIKFINKKIIYILFLFCIAMASYSFISGYYEWHQILDFKRICMETYINSKKCIILPHEIHNLQSEYANGINVALIPLFLIAIFKFYKNQNNKIIYFFLLPILSFLIYNFLVFNFLFT